MDKIQEKVKSVSFQGVLKIMSILMFFAYV